MLKSIKFAIFQTVNIVFQLFRWRYFKPKLRCWCLFSNYRISRRITNGKCRIIFEIFSCKIIWRVEQISGSGNTVTVPTLAPVWLNVLRVHRLKQFGNSVKWKFHRNLHLCDDVVLNFFHWSSTKRRDFEVLRDWGHLYEFLVSTPTKTFQERKNR